VLAVCFVLPLVQPWKIAELPAASDLTLGALGPVVTERGTPVERVAAPPAAQPPAARTPGPTLIAVALVAGAVLRLAWLSAGLLRLRSLRKAGERAAPCDGHDELATLIEAGAEIRYVRVLGQPVTFGVRRPVVLLPEALRALPDGVQRAILAHELWHVRRRDWVWILAEEIARSVLWFHPAISFVISRVQSAREEVVDELTVLLTNSRRSYLEALLTFADKPALFAAAPFARRRHLFHRMLLISREAVMSSRRVVLSGATVVVVLLGTVVIAAASFPLTAPARQPAPAVVLPAADAVVSPAADAGAQSDWRVWSDTVRQHQSVQAPPRDPQRLPPPRPAAVEPSRETELKKAIAAAPTASVTLYYELAKLQEYLGAKTEAEATLQAGRRAFPGHDGILRQLTSFYLRNDSFEKAIAALEDEAAADPSNPAGHHRVATFYEEKIRKSPDLSPTEKKTYIQAAIAAEDRALTHHPDFLEAMIFKNLLLRHQANLESDASLRQQLIAEADALRNRAMGLKTQGTPLEGRVVSGQRTSTATVDGQAPLRVGGSIKPPTKVRDVRPAYPPEAMMNRVEGVVILEVVVDTSGRVADAKVLRSIPLLDQAAVDAVRQWEFAPTQLNGAAVPVILTVTVNFKID
jgi:protein TonB